MAGRNGETGFHWNGVSVWEDEKALCMDGGDVCTRVRIYLIPLNCPLKDG